MAGNWPAVWLQMGHDPFWCLLSRASSLFLSGKQGLQWSGKRNNRTEVWWVWKAPCTCVFNVHLLSWDSVSGICMAKFDISQFADNCIIFILRCSVIRYKECRVRHTWLGTGLFLQLIFQGPKRNLCPYHQTLTFTPSPSTFLSELCNLSKLQSPHLWNGNGNEWTNYWLRFI